jgi:hypothetical protein
MLELWTAVPVLVAFVALGVLGVRLLVRGLRERGAEALIGGVAVSFSLMVLTVVARVLLRSEGLALLYVSHAFFCTASILFLSFTCVVFQPDRPWARLLVIGVSVPLVGLYALRGVVGEEHLLTRVVLSAVRLPAFWWPLVECVKYRRRLSRQLRVGLGDPVVANRFLLWSIWIGGLAFTPTLSFVSHTLSLLLGTPDVVSGSATGSSILLAVLVIPAGAAAAVALWLSFYPPSAYLRWLRGPQVEGA